MHQKQELYTMWGRVVSRSFLAVSDLCMRHACVCVYMQCSTDLIISRAGVNCSMKWLLGFTCQESLYNNLQHLEHSDTALWHSLANHRDRYGKIYLSIQSHVKTVFRKYCNRDIFVIHNSAHVHHISAHARSDR